MTMLRCLVLAMLLAILLPLSAFAGPSYDLYTDSYQSGWGKWSWGSTEAENSTASYVFKGTKSIKVTYTAAWGGFAPGAPSTFSTVGYRDLTFAVYNYSGGDDLYVLGMNSAGTYGNNVSIKNYTGAIDTNGNGTIPQGRWSWVRIPIADLGLGSSPTLSYVAIRSSKPAVVYIDEMSFVASTVLYEGVKTNTAPSIRSWSGRPYWNWSSSVDAHLLDSLVSKTDYYLKVTPSQVWGGIGFLERTTNLVTTNYGALAIRFKQDTASQRVWVALVDKTGAVLGLWVKLDEAYLPTTLQPIKNGVWYHVTVPMSAFGVSSTNVTGVVFESNTASAAFYLDDVRFVQKLEYPIKDYPKESSGYSFGQLWDEPHNCPGYNKYHTGVDYRTLYPRNIYAASRGLVKETGTQGTYGGYLTIQHENTLTTSYLHTNPVSGIVPNTEVQRGQLIGTTANIASPHLHFNVRMKNNDGNTQNGALPLSTTSACNYPAFPAYFLDPENIFPR